MNTVPIQTHTIETEYFFEIGLETASVFDGVSPPRFIVCHMDTTALNGSSLYEFIELFKFELFSNLRRVRAKTLEPIKQQFQSFKANFECDQIDACEIIITELLSKACGQTARIELRVLESTCSKMHLESMELKSNPFEHVPGVIVGIYNGISPDLSDAHLFVVSKRFAGRICQALPSWFSHHSNLRIEATLLKMAETLDQSTSFRAPSTHAVGFNTVCPVLTLRFEAGGLFDGEEKIVENIWNGVSLGIGKPYDPSIPILALAALENSIVSPTMASTGIADKLMTKTTPTSPSTIAKAD